MFKALTWTGGYQFYVLTGTIILASFIGTKNIYFAMYGFLIPGFVLTCYLLSKEYKIYSCSKCKKFYAGPRLAKYVHGDDTYT